MKVLFLTITLGLITALQAQDPLFFPSENENIIGTWYVKAVVADKDLPKEKRPKKVSPLTVTALDGGDLEAMVTFMKGGQCHEKRVVMHQTEEPGRYSTCESRPGCATFPTRAQASPSPEAACCLAVPALSPPRSS
ncbi:odorant-binding protein 2b-like [Equus quagga]|uniref:odorant-binding protein 2b-like n=1 Tax=Equus quagga TaxID=89248 RepID=UPI001EE20203|nr:odorant-binding protein 2b-like [Equus quagga]